MAYFHLALLGGFEARVASGAGIAISRAKARALLAYLALHPGQRFARDTLAALLWPDDPEERARHSLRQALVSVRRACAGIDLLAEGDAVTLPPALLTTDVHAFERSASGDKPDDWLAASELYRGYLLEGLRVSEPPFEEWLIGERERLRELAVHGLGRLLMHERRAGRMMEAIRVAARIVTADPLQEDAHRMLMHLYAESGQRAQALRQFRACARALRRELDVDPEPETQRLYEELRRKTMAATGAAWRDRPGHSSGGSAAIPLIARHAELSALVRALDAAWTGSGRVSVLSGEAGVGKTRLTEEIVAQGHSRGGRVLVGRSYEMEQQILSFGPWLDALRPTVVAEATPGPRSKDARLLAGLEPAWRSQLARLFPESGMRPPEVVGPGGEHSQLFEAVAGLLMCMCRDAPLLLVLEDLHWADDTSLRLLAYVARRLDRQPFLIVATMRDDELGEGSALRALLQALDRDSRCDRITVTPLSREDTAALARALAGGRAVSAELEQRMCDASEGNPFVVVEMMREIHGSEVRFDADRSDLPARVSELIANRLDRLDGPAAALVDIAAVVGRDFEPVLLQAAAGVASGEAAAAIDVLVRHRVLAFTRDRRLDFTHDRIRTVAASRLTPTRKMSIHESVARAIETLYGADVEARVAGLATHYLEAEVWDKAATYLAMAGRQAVMRGANRDAVGWFERALAALARVPGGAESEHAIDLHFGIRTALQQSGEFDRMLAELGAAERLSVRRDDRQRLGWVLVFKSELFWRTGQQDAACACGEEALAIGKALGDPSLEAAASKYLGQARFTAGLLREAIERLELAVRWARLRSGDDRAGLARAGYVAELASGWAPEQAFGWLVWALGELGKFEQGIALATESGQLVTVRDRPLALCMLLTGLGELYCCRGDFGAAIDTLEHARELVRRYEFRVNAFPVYRTLGYAHALTGRTAEGVALLREASGVAGSPQRPRPQFTRFLEQRGRASLIAGDLSEAMRYATEAVERARARRERGMEAHALRLLADANATGVSKDGDAAERYYREALAIGTELGMRPLVARCHHGLARVHAGCGRVAAARDHGDLAAEMAREMGLRDLDV